MFPWGIIVDYEIDIIGQCCLNIIQCCMIDSKKIDGHSHFGPEKGEYSHRNYVIWFLKRGDITITCTPINAIGDINKNITSQHITRYPRNSAKKNPVSWIVRKKNPVS